MSAIDSGALLRMNGKFVNKNCNLFMGISNTGYILEKAKYADPSIYDGDVYIKGNFYVYAGDENFLLTFYKGYFYVISNGEIIYSVSYNPFISETIIVNGITVKVSHLDPDIQIEKDRIITWEEYVRNRWMDATGTEKLSELENGARRYREYIRQVKKSKRNKGCKYRTGRWIARWEYNGDKYEVIFGSGIDPDEETWNRIKAEAYDFTAREIEIIDRWFEG